MKLWIDEQYVTAQPGQSLLDLIHQLGLDSNKLSKRPLAAKIAGEIFNLNYIPVRPQDVLEERTSIRRAMAASNGRIHLLRYSDPSGRTCTEERHSLWFFWQFNSFGQMQGR